MATPRSFHVLFFLSVVLLNSIRSESAVASIDLGSESLKVAVVNLKPGQAPISIAINEMSKRKTPNLISFHADTRLIGEESLNLLARYPTKVYSHLPSVLAKPCNFALDFFRSLYLNYDVAPDDSRDVAVFKTGEDGEFGNFTAEEMVGMVLKYAVGLAETQARMSIRDVVITVPPYMGVAERRSLLTAAELAEINVLALVNEHSGASLQYGIDKDFSNGSRHVLFYDMGASSTYAALVYFSAYNSKEVGKTVSINQFQVKDVRWAEKLGGQNMELKLVEYFADEFNKQLGDGFDIRNSPKAMAKLKKQVKRTKEILSANMMAPISVESLHDDRDFRSTISREKFEELCEDLWEKALAPIKEVLGSSGLKADDLYAVELIGGATRVPKLQTMLQEFIGKELNKHLDADEAIVLGASLHAANLSDGIKLNRKLGMIDGSTYGFVFELDGEGLLKDENTRQLILPKMKKLPSKMFRSIAHNKDFEVSLAYESKDSIPPGAPSQTFAKYDVSGLTASSEKYSTRNLSSPIKANLHFSLSRSGIFSLDRADAVIEITEWVEVPRKNLTVDNSTSSTVNTTDTVSGNVSDENSDKLDTDNGTNNKTDVNVDDPNTLDLGTEKKLKKRTFRVALKVVEKTTGPGMPLAKELFTRSKQKIKALDKKDEERRKTAELKNNLEGYIYSTKDKLESDELEKISSDQERKAFLEKLNEVEEWLYTEGEDASANDFKEHLDMLKAIGDPIFFRHKELTSRPAASEHAKVYLTEVQQIVQRWEKDKSWLPKERIEEVLHTAEKLKIWLSDKEAEQKKASMIGTPAFTSDEVNTKIFDLQDKIASINRIPKPKPKVEKPSKVETESSGDQGNATDFTPKEENSSENQTGDPDTVDIDKADSEPKGHDEL